MLEDWLLDATDLETARALVQGGADAARLYAAWFHRDTGDPCAWPEAGAYRAAMTDPARYEAGWRVVAAAEGVTGAVSAERGEEQRSIAPPQLAPATMADIALGPGAAILVDPLGGDVQGGFWHLWSAQWRTARPAALQRVYAPVRPQTSAAFVRAVSRTAAADAAWTAKALTGAHDAGRRDGAVLYLDSALPLGSGWAATLLATIAPLADGALPPFVQPLAGGLGWARDPGGGESFGQAAARALAGLGEAADDPARFRAAAGAAVAPLIGTPS